MVVKLLQYVIVRKDILPKNMNSGAFSLGACMAQACHAATAAIVQSFSDSNTQEYLKSIGDMTVCVLGVEDGNELTSLSEKLAGNDIQFHLWIEKPEDVPTALATVPVTKEHVFPILGHLKLLR